MYLNVRVRFCMGSMSRNTYLQAQNQPPLVCLMPVMALVGTGALQQLLKEAMEELVPVVMPPHTPTLIQATPVPSRPTFIAVQL